MDFDHVVNNRNTGRTQIVLCDILPVSHFAIINEEFFITCLPHQMHPPRGKYPDHICPDHMHNVVGILH